MWRVYDAVDGTFLGGVVVEPVCPVADPSPCAHLFGFTCYISTSLSTAVTSALRRRRAARLC